MKEGKKMLTTEQAMEAVEEARKLYPHGTMSREKRDAMRAEYNAEHKRIESEFREWLAQEFTPNLTAEVQAAVWTKAWADRHDGSLRGVADEYESLAALVNLAAETGLR